MDIWTISYADLLWLPGRLLRRRPFIADFQECFRIERALELEHLCDQTGPAGLVAGAKPGAVVAMEVFVKQQVILPVGICLEFFRAAENRTPAILVTQKDAGQPSGQFHG